MNSNALLNEGMTTAFIDSENKCKVGYKPQFISNNYKEGKKVISCLQKELLECDSFDISVAFITDGGIAPLLPIFKILEEKNVRGRILTTDYLGFNEPKALKKLAQFKNIDLKMYMTENKPIGFHTKGYIFKSKELYKIIIGSSNLTQKALSVNKEWNTKLISTENGEYVKNILEEFESFWNSNNAKNYDEFISAYELKYSIMEKQRKVISTEKISSIEEYKLQPNKMQVNFVRNVKELLDQGENKGLLVSATGTGKTYASAFAIRELNLGRSLFLVHREQIAKQALKSYKKIFGSKKTFGLLSGNHRDYDVDFLFSTMQTMSKEDVYTKFDKKDFDVIIVDEAHRVGANSYQKLLEYFEPKFLLGMTASPERTDDFDVYRQFDNNIACEIRLQEALEEDFLCPFHYFGISELDIEGKEIDENTQFENFNRLVSEDRVNHIIEQSKFYGYSGEKVNGLIFCSNKKEAKELSEKFNEKGLNTIALTGEDSQSEREDAIDRLTNKDAKDKLDYIITVDIFNEGVDIPEINQVIMLRPTKSPIIFVQQLGRGLRKATDKEYVNILDFIGNYTNNFMIPIALSGDKSYNKDNIRKYLAEGERIIPGASTIYFDEISKKKIYQAIDSADFNDVKIIKESYKNLKYKLGRIPTLREFDIYGEIDVLRIFDNKSLGSYYKFLTKYEDEYDIKLNDKETKYIEFISKKFANGKRVNELEFLKILINSNNENVLDSFKENMKIKYNLNIGKNEEENIINIFVNEFATGTGKDTYKDCIFIEKNGNNNYVIASRYKKMLENRDFANMINELIEFGMSRYFRDYSNTYKDNQFVLYKKYTYDDVCRILNWKHGEVPLNIGGYKYDKETKTFPVFINYEKDKNINDTIKYEDHFESEDKLIAISKSGRNFESEDVKNFIYSKERGIKVELFVRKNKDDKISKEFYYLGRLNYSGNAEEIKMANTNKKAVEIEWNLETPVRSDVYEYLLS